MEISLLAANTAILLILSIAAAVGVYFLYRINAFINGFIEVDTSPPQEDDDEKAMSVYEQERMERDREFDKRIRGLKEELAMQQDVKERKGTEADVLHPGIQNLPHDEVKTKYDLYPEVAE